MPLYRFQAITKEGKKTKGVIDADSLLLAKDRLRKQQVLVTDLVELAQKKQMALDPALLLAFTRELSQLLQAGLPLYESLLTIEEKYRSHRSHFLFLDLCDSLKNGSSLSNALKKYPRSFDPIYLSMVQAAEHSGSLAEIFEQLTLLIGKHQRLKKQLTSALIYPAFLGAFCVIVVTSLLVFVVPSMRELFEGRSLHPLTRAVLTLSAFVTRYGFSMFLASSSFIALLFWLLQKEEMRLRMERLFLKIPFLSTIIKQSALIRLFRSLSILLRGGVPLIQALGLSRKMVKQKLIEKVVEEAEQKMAEGQKLSTYLKKAPLIPSLAVRMISIAEETGKMAPMLQSVADIYDEELERSLAQITTFLQPILLLIMGAIVGLIVLSVLLPLTDVSSFLSG